jgi:hypothetical protein
MKYSSEATKLQRKIEKKKNPLICQSGKIKKSTS